MTDVIVQIITALSPSALPLVVCVLGCCFIYFKIKASLYEGSNGYSPNLNFDQMGFSWQFDSYPPDETTQYKSQEIVEAYAAGRPYFAIRNIKK